VLVPALAADVALDRETRTRIGRRRLAAERMARGSPDGWTIFGVTGFSQLCEQRLNLPSSEGWQLRSAAAALEKSKELVRQVAGGEVNLAKAAAVGSVIDLAREAGQGEEAKLLDFAATAGTSALREPQAAQGVVGAGLRA